MPRLNALVALGLVFTTMAPQARAQPAEPVEATSTPAPEVASSPAYVIDLEIDLPLLAVPTVVLLAWPLSDTLAAPHCAPLCAPHDLNPFDAPAAGLYDERWATASDIGVGILLASATLVPFMDEAPLDALNDLVVILQAIAWTNATGLLVAMATRRPRPFMYSEEAPLAMRQKPTSAFSFFSSHTGSAFAASTALFQTLRRRHPDSAGPWIALGIGDAIAALVAVGRVEAGHHFPSDVIAGALVGTSLGLLLPALHDQPVQVAPIALPGGVGISVGGAL